VHCRYPPSVSFSQSLSCKRFTGPGIANDRFPPIAVIGLMWNFSPMRAHLTATILVAASLASCQLSDNATEADNDALPKSETGVAVAPATNRIYPKECVDGSSMRESRSLMAQAEAAISKRQFTRTLGLLDRFERTFSDPLPNPPGLIDDSDQALSLADYQKDEGDLRGAAVTKHQALSSRLELYDWKCGRRKDGRFSAGIAL